MDTESNKIAARRQLFEELRVLDSGYIIVKEEILRLLIDEAPPEVLLAAQRVLKDKWPSPSDLDPTSPTICWDVKILRKAHKISQMKLAEKANMEQPDISEFERNGSESFGEDRKQRIVEALKKLITSKST